MATQYSNKPIVTSGLVYALDFGNTKSYVSGSSSASSLKFNNVISASIFTFGGATLPDLQNGLLKIIRGATDTTGSRIDFNAQFSELRSTGSFTIQTTVGATSNTLMFLSQNGLVSDHKGVFGFPFSAPLPYGNPSRSTTTKSLPPGLKHITYRYSSGSYDLFVNGVPVHTTNRNTHVTGNSGNFTINGRRGVSDDMSTIDLGNLYIYNRALTSDEIYSNYLIQAQRYGLPTVPKPYTIDENAFLFLSQSGITDPIITGSIDTFVRGLKSASLWDKMIAIYPFVGTGSAGVNLTGSQSWNLKEPTSAFYRLAFTGSWNGSTSGSAPSGSNTSINTGVLPFEFYPFKSDSNQHISILSYDTPVSSSYLMGTGMTEDLAISTLAGDYGTPAAAYSVRKVRTAYTGALMDVRRSIDNVTSSIGFVSNGDLDTGSLLNFVREYSQSFAVTVINDGTANIFVLNGVNKPELTLFRGGVYTFDQSDTTNSGHQIAFKSGSESYTTGSVTTGTLGQAGAKTVLTVSMDAPNDLRYYCVAHGDYMGNTITVTANTGSGFVARWYDQSGNNRHATQTATGSQPMIVLSGSVILDSNRPALSFNGTSHDITSTFGTTISQPITVYSIFKPDLTGSIHPIYSGGILHYIQGSRYISWAAVTLISSQVTTLNKVLNTSVFKGTSSFFNINSVLDKTGNTGTSSTNSLRIGAWTFGTTYYFTGKIQEIVMHPSDQSNIISPVEYGINNYYNIYNQPSASFATSSFTIQATPTAISGAINNRLTSGIPSSGPLGLITVSRTGSNSLTIARNGVTSSFAVPASGALSTGIFLGAINNNGLALGNSPLNLSFASVGTGLTGADVSTLNNLVNILNYGLNRGLDNDYLNVLNYARIQGFTLPSHAVQAAQNLLLTSLKAAGVWQKLDTFFLCASDGSINFTCLDWKNPGVNSLNTAASPSTILDPNKGLKKVSSTDSGGITGPLFTTATAVNVTTSSAAVYVYEYEHVTGITVFFGLNNFTRMRYRNGISNDQNIGGTTPSAPFTYSVTAFPALKSIQFTTPSTITFTSQKTQYPHSTVSTAITIPGSNNVSFYPGSNVYGTISLFAYGASLLNENSDFVDAVDSYFTAISS